MKIKVLVVSVFALFANLAHAVTCQGVVKYITVKKDVTLFALKEYPNQELSIPKTDSYSGSGTAGLKEYYSMITHSLAANKKISVTFSDYDDGDSYRTYCGDAVPEETFVVRGLEIKSE